MSLHYSHGQKKKIINENIGLKMIKEMYRKHCYPQKIKLNKNLFHVHLQYQSKRPIRKSALVQFLHSASIFVLFVFIYGRPTFSEG